MKSPQTLAILADVHGNMPALEAVLADVERLAPDEVLVGGDLVGRGPEGSRVVAAIRERGWTVIRGNHEEYMLDFRRHRVPERWWTAPEWSASRWMAAELGDADLDYLEALPSSARSRLDPDLLLVHGTPESAHRGLGPWTPDERLDAHLEASGVALLVCGHTHRPMDRRVTAGRVINTGSVGLPFNRDPRAQYLVLRRREAGWEAEFRRLDYDREAIFRIYRESGFRAAGGVTARLLELELREAAPFLVPFQRWAAHHQRPPGEGAVAEFLEWFEPDRWHGPRHPEPEG